MVYQRRKRGEGINLEFWVSRYELLFIKQRSNNVLQNSTGNYIHYLVITYNEKESDKDDICTYTCIYTYVIITLLSETNTNSNSIILQLKKKIVSPSSVTSGGRGLFLNWKEEISETQWVFKVWKKCGQTKTTVLSNVSS